MYTKRLEASVTHSILTQLGNLGWVVDETNPECNVFQQRAKTEEQRKLLKGNNTIQWEPRAHAREHSLEIQIPFLQTVLSDFRIVPILMGEQNYETCRSVATILAHAIGSSEGTLILASTDLSHFHSYQQAKALDAAFIKHVADFDAWGLAQSLASGKCEACGAGPTMTALLTARRQGANRSTILRYANSGDVTGDHSRVVGYLSAALSRVVVEGGISLR